jgi:hypothetical protein
MAVVLKASLGQPGDFFFRIPSPANDPKVLLHLLSDPSNKEKDDVVPKGGKEVMHGSWDQRGEEMKKGEKETDLPT